jgi:NAD(P)-dependent dehydrogenase (short-subunit alcohol dehydrogenase family)
MNFQDRFVLVTGASSGLGFEIAQSLSKAGARVLGVGRRQNLLDIHYF